MTFLSSVLNGKDDFTWMKYTHSGTGRERWLAVALAISYVTFKAAKASILCPTWTIYLEQKFQAKLMVTLLQNLNIPISKSKLTPSTTKINCLGIEVNSVKTTLSIPTEKLGEILQECVKFKNQKHFTRRQLQSVIGKLMFIHKVVKPARLFVNRLLETLSSMENKATMSTEVLKDINWFCQLVQKFNGTCQYMYTPVACVETIELDACSTGFGARYKDFVYQYQFRQGEITNSSSITHIEMWNVLVALRMWGHMWAKKSVVIRCDNQAVVSVVNTSVTKNHILATMCRNIWLETAMK